MKKITKINVYKTPYPHEYKLGHSKNIHSNKLMSLNCDRKNITPYPHECKLGHKKILQQLTSINCDEKRNQIIIITPHPYEYKLGQKILQQLTSIN